MSSASGLPRTSRADRARTLPAYRMYERGELVDEVPDASGAWRENLVAFLIGCSFVFERALLDAGVPVRHLESWTNVPMYRTSVPTRRAGSLGGPLVISMRPVPASLVDPTTRTAMLRATGVTEARDSDYLVPQ